MPTITPFSYHLPRILEGYPAMVVYNDDVIPYYHSDKDLPLDEDVKYFEEMRAREDD